MVTKLEKNRTNLSFWNGFENILTGIKEQNSTRVSLDKAPFC